MIYITPQGRAEIANTPEMIDRFWKKIAIKSQDECWEWMAEKNKRGYGVFHIKRLSKSRRIRELAHRMSYLLAVGPIGCLHVLHHCDNPSCVNPSHLFLGTHQDNMADMYKKGRHRAGRSPGELNPKAKITLEIAKTIRHLYFAEQIPQHEICKFFNVSKYLVYKVVRMKSWKPNYA